MDIIPFDFSGNKVTVLIDQSGNPWWVAAEICVILGLSNTTVAVSRLPENLRSKFNLGRQGETNIVNESGLYLLIMNSRKKGAIKFQEWIATEVLPSIRKRGYYIQPGRLPTRKELAQMVIEAEEKAERLSIENKELKPKAILNIVVTFVVPIKSNIITDYYWKYVFSTIYKKKKDPSPYPIYSTS